MKEILFCLAVLPSFQPTPAAAPAAASVSSTLDNPTFAKRGPILDSAGYPALFTVGRPRDFFAAATLSVPFTSHV